MRVAYPLAVALLFACAFGLRVFFASAYPTMFWADEIFQSLEQAHRLVFGNGVVPWEFRVGARSWILPGFLAGVMAATSGLAPGASGYLTGVRVVLSLLSLSLPLAAFVLARRRHGQLLPLMAAGFVGCWYELVYFAPKAFAEVVAAHLFVPALLPLSAAAPTRRGAIVAGSLLGVAVALRPHFAPAALLAGFLFLRNRRALLRPLAWSFFALVVAGGLLDALTWGAPFQSIWENLRANVSGVRAERNSETPWFGFLIVAGRVWWPWTFALLALIYLGARGQRLLVVSCLALLATHTLFAHKEYRYVYLCLCICIVLASLGLCELARLCRERLALPLWLARAGGLSLLAGALYASFSLGLRYDFRATSLQGSSGEPPLLWTHFRGMLLAFEELSADASVCGVGLENRRWDRSGGYTYLHRDVPLFQITDNAAYRQYASAFNVFVASASSPPQIGHFSRTRCWDTVCVYRRPGPCIAVPGYDINQQLIAAGD